LIPQTVEHPPHFDAIGRVSTSARHRWLVADAYLLGSRQRQAKPATANGADTLSLLPVEIQIGDRFTDEGFEWQVMTHPAALHRCACG
jgi:hypothetical protein